MQKILRLFLAVLATTFTSCKFDETIVGTYTGTYNSFTLPVSNGTGTITITNASPGRVNLLFVSSGNPDVQVNNLIFKRTTNLLHYYFTLSTENTNDIGHSNTINYSLDFNNPSNPEFYFNGTKQ